MPWAEEPGGLQSMGSRKSLTRLSDSTTTTTTHFQVTLSTFILNFSTILKRPYAKTQIYMPEKRLHFVSGQPTVCFF